MSTDSDDTKTHIHGSCILHIYIIACIRMRIVHIMQPDTTDTQTQPRDKFEELAPLLHTILIVIVRHCFLCQKEIICNSLRLYLESQMHAYKCIRPNELSHCLLASSFVCHECFRYCIEIPPSLVDFQPNTKYYMRIYFLHDCYESVVLRKGVFVVVARPNDCLRFLVI